MYIQAFKVLEILEASEKPVETNEIAMALSLSKSAVWKHINELRQLGYDITASDDEGYVLHDKNQDFRPHIIYRHLKTRLIGRKMRFFKTIPSTIWYGKDLAEQGGIDELSGMVIIAEEQTGGVGRMGRAWVSPAGGIWVTIILQPQIPIDHLFMLTLAASVSVARVLRKMYDIGALIKWPNDIIIGDKKVAGILLELGAEGEKVQYCLLGMGIDANVNLDSLNQSIRGTMTSISQEVDKDIDRAVLLAAILKEFENRYEMIIQGEYDAVIREWKNFSSTIGRRVRIITLRSLFEGEAIDVDPNGALVVKKDNGKIERVIAGDCIHI
ncbi:MAG: biotin--[acetyl-CoA-carboxylase] ligase [Methanomicrobiales archaeon]|nr:biotin--[acetyl-CoA-carboxylase] ligase [Methanomicrobiales archaeon]